MAIELKQQLKLSQQLVGRGSARVLLEGGAEVLLRLGSVEGGPVLLSEAEIELAAQLVGTDPLGFGGLRHRRGRPSRRAAAPGRTG